MHEVCMGGMYRKFMSPQTLQPRLSGGAMGMYHCVVECLQCFDAVGWAAGRASGL